MTDWSFLDDVDVFTEVRNNHVPSESRAGAAGWRSEITCSFCEKDWPCPAVIEIRRRDEELSKRFAEMKAEAVEAEQRKSLAETTDFNFRSEMAGLLNKYGFDIRLRTMDWILADYLAGMLESAQEMLYQRDTKQTDILDPQRQLGIR